MSEDIAVFIKTFELYIFQWAFLYQKRALPDSFKVSTGSPSVIYISILSYPSSYSNNVTKSNA
jgi:hypothetical protein